VLSLFYRNPRLLTLTICLVLVAGLSAYHSMPRLEDPELTKRFGMVKTYLPGASPERVETLVTEKVENELEEIEEIQTLTSTSSTGISLISVELADAVMPDEVNEVWSRVRDQISDAVPELPAGATEPEFEDFEARAYAMILGLTWKQDDEPSYAILRRMAEELADELRALPGTEDVELYGDPDEEIVIEVDQVRLASMGLTVADVSNQIRASDAKISAGQLRSSTDDLLVEIDTELDSLDRIRTIPIRFGSGGDVVHLGDIATIRKATAEPFDDLAIIEGRPGIAVAVYVSSSRRIDVWAATARSVADDFAASLPRGVGLTMLFDQSGYTAQRLSQLMRNMLLGAAAVIAVILVMMGWRSAVLVGVALPLSVLMVFAVMQLIGIPIHQMSVTGLILALGLLIDNAIVIVDDVRRNLHDGMPSGPAITKSVRHLGVPLLGSTLTTALAFMPIALLPGPAGEFVGTISIGVIIALFSSLFLSLTVIPGLAGLIHDRFRFADDPETGSWFSRGYRNTRMTRAYRRSLTFIFARPILGVGLAVVLPLLGFWAGTTLKEQFFPAADRDQFHLEVELPAQASLEQTKAAVHQVRQSMLEHPEVTGVHWFLGRSAPTFYYNVVKFKDGSPRYAQAIVQLSSEDRCRETIRELQDQLDDEFPGLRVLVRQLEQGPPFEAPIEVLVYGPDLDKLRDLGNQVRAELSRIPDVVHSRAGLTEALPKLGFAVDEEEARLSQLNNAEVARQLNATLEGAVGGSLLEATEELPVRVRLSNVERGQLERIRSLDLLPQQSGNGESAQFVPITALGDVELQSEVAAITRKNSRRVNTVQAFITAGVLPADVLSQLRPKLESGDIELPPGYWYSFGGEAEQRDEAIAALLGPIGVLMVLMVATLVLSFGSFRLGAVILSVAALAAGPGLLALWVFGFPFGFMAIVGTMGLVGVAINDSIVVLAALEESHMARERSLTAITDVVLTATRHVLATTVTTIAGFIPLLLSGGRFWPPLAIAIAGGVSGSTLLALYFVPSMYLLVKRRKEPELDSGREFHAILDEIDEPYAEPAGLGSRVR